MALYHPLSIITDKAHSHVRFIAGTTAPVRANRNNRNQGAYAMLNQIRFMRDLFENHQTAA